MKLRVVEQVKLFNLKERADMWKRSESNDIGPVHTLLGKSCDWVRLHMPSFSLTRDTGTLNDNEMINLAITEISNVLRTLVMGLIVVDWDVNILLACFEVTIVHKSGIKATAKLLDRTKYTFELNQTKKLPFSNRDPNRLIDCERNIQTAIAVKIIKCKSIKVSLDDIRGVLSELLFDEKLFELKTYSNVDFYLRPLVPEKNVEVKNTRMGWLGPSEFVFYIV